MLLDSAAIESRLNSNANLMNRLKTIPSRVSVCLPIPPNKILNPEILPVKQDEIAADDLVEDLDLKIKRGSLKTKAVDLISSSLDRLGAVINDVDKPSQLSKIATDMGKVLQSLEEKKADDSQKGQQIIIYRPMMKTENHFESIQVNE